MTRKILVILAVIGTAGCMAPASRQIPDSQTIPVPADRVLAKAQLAPIDGSGSVAVKRDDGMAGSWCAVLLSVDGKPAAQLMQRERVELHLSAGEHVLSASPTGQCGGGLAEVATLVKTGEAKSFRISSGGDLALKIGPTAF